MFPLRRFRVEDDSMQPALEPGDYVLVNRWAYRLRAPRTGDLVVLRDPENPGRFLIKRLANSADPGRLTVLGDNESRSRDSRTFGSVDRRDLIGKVWRRLKP